MVPTRADSVGSGWATDGRIIDSVAGGRTPNDYFAAIVTNRATTSTMLHIVIINSESETRATDVQS